MRSWLVCLFAAPALAAHELICGDIYTFERYIQDHDKHYTAKEYGMRKRLFERRVEEIMAHNSEAVSSYRRGVNDLTDRTDEELEALLGRKHTARSIMRTRHYGGAPLRNSHYPEEVDWRKAGVLTPPKNQGHCGSCWTFSGSEAIEAALAISTGKLVNISQQAFLSCTPNGEHCGGKGGCSGATQDILFEWAVENGAYLEDDYPYVSGNGNETSCQLTDKKPVASIKGFVDVEDNNHDAHMAAIQTQPVSVSVDASKWHLYSSGIMDFDECGPNINHAVLLVGYGTKNKTQNFWTIKNSWGTKWGEGGYIRLSRSTKCAIDTKPEDGTSCEGAIPADLEVCGTCGVLYSSSYPVGAHWL